jgi:SSS family solute:Na+ symporter
MVWTIGLSALFFAIIVAILYATKRADQDKSFSEYAVGGRSFSAIYIAMSYTNSWWPGTTFIAFFGLAAAAGAIGLYALLYSLIGVTAMYFMARRAWKWGQRHNLYTQPDMMGLRFNSPTLKVIASVIGVVAIFPWIVLGMQAMATLVQWATKGSIDTTLALVIGIAVIAVRQIWTVQMGMRGLVITDLVQGYVAYIGCAILCVGILLFSDVSFARIDDLPAVAHELPGFGSDLGGFYFLGIVLTGIIGSLCWPTSYQRIYTASSVREVKRGTLLTMPIAGIFYALLCLVALAAMAVPEVAAAPQEGWFAVNQVIGGDFLLGVAILIVFAASMGWVDGVIQVVGAQISNDVVGQYQDLSDRRRIQVAKISMVVFLVLGAFVAWLAYDYDKLINFAQVSYQGIIQLAVPMFAGLFWKRGNSTGAIAGLLVGFAIALGLTIPYAGAGGAIPWLEGFPAGLVALAVNLGIYVACAYLIPQPAEEDQRVLDLFDEADEPSRARVPVGAAVPAPAGLA